MPQPDPPITDVAWAQDQALEEHRRPRRLWYSLLVWMISDWVKDRDNLRHTQSYRVAHRWLFLDPEGRDPLPVGSLQHVCSLLGCSVEDLRRRLPEMTMEDVDRMQQALDDHDSRSGSGVGPPAAADEPNT